jgi:hypothetical protein
MRQRSVGRRSGPTPIFPSEGRACRVRRITFDNPFHFRGHDKRAPPFLLSDGLACRVRRIRFDNPFHFRGHDKRAPPFLLSDGLACRVRRITFDNPFHFRGHDKRAPLTWYHKRAAPIYLPNKSEARAKASG